MFEGYRVVVVCPAGRRRVADLMRRYVERARPVVDKLHWWLNTDVADDLDYFQVLTQAAPDFHRLITMAGSSRFSHRHMGIGRFFQHTVDPKTIYVRVDDDVVWMDEGCIPALLTQRLQYPEAYLVYANIVNSSRFMHLHQKHGAFDPGFEIAYALSHPTNRLSVDAGLAAHEAFLDTLEAIAAGGDKETLLKPWKALGRHIFAAGEYNDANMLCWFGRDFAAWGGICPHFIHEEQWICLRMPCEHGGRIHEACGDALCVHYASAPQWRGIAACSKVLERYASLAPPSQIVTVPAATLFDDALSLSQRQRKRRLTSSDRSRRDQ